MEETVQKRFAFPPLLFLIIPAIYALFAVFPAFDNPDYCFCGIVGEVGISAASVSFYSCVGYLGPKVAAFLYLGLAFLSLAGIIGALGAFLPKLRNGRAYGFLILGGLSLGALSYIACCTLAAPEIERVSAEYYAIAYEPKGTTVDFVSAYSYANVWFYVQFVSPFLVALWWLAVLLLSLKQRKAINPN